MLGIALAFLAAGPAEITVYAAASLRESLQEIAADYEKANPVKVVFNFGSSGDLARQILAANKADLFFSADEKEMDRVASDGRIEEGTRKSILSNQLVVIEWIDPEDPPSSFFIPGAFQPVYLTRPHIRRLALADPEAVPAGRYAKAWLEKRKVWPAVRDRVLPGVDVRAALASVESGAAQAGIVYRTDAKISKKVRVVFEVPLDEGPFIAYVLGVLKQRPNAAEVHRFADHLASEPAQKVFERFGFVVPKPKEK
jgi:molybdate transport system substrate-binding protein